MRGIAGAVSALVSNVARYSPPCLLCCSSFSSTAVLIIGTRSLTSPHHSNGCDVELEEDKVASYFEKDYGKKGDGGASNEE